MMEAKSSMLPIVAGPTAGSCGVVPGSLLAMCDAMKADETTIINIFFAASIIGVAIAQGTKKIIINFYHMFSSIINSLSLFLFLIRSREYICCRRRRMSSRVWFC